MRDPLLDDRDQGAMQPEEVERFIWLLTASEHEVYRYIYAMVPDPNDAQDVFQETSIALWRNFGEYDASRPFTPWACRFAYHHVLKLRMRGRHATQWLNDALIARIADVRLAEKPDLDERRDALTHCVEKLLPEARHLVERRYYDGLTVQEIARQTGRRATTLYRAFERIQRWLAECIERKIDGGGGS